MKKFTFFIAALISLFCTQNAGAQDDRSYTSEGNGWTLESPLYRQTTFYLPNGVSESNQWFVRMFTNPGNSFYVMEYQSGGGQQLYVGLSGNAATDENTIVRAAAKWDNGFYCNQTVVLPGGEVFVTAGGKQYEMTNTGNYQYEAIIPHNTTVSISGADVIAVAQAENGMPSGGVPSSLKLEILNKTVTISQSSTQVKYIKVKFNLWSNQVTFEDAITITDNQNHCFPFGYGINITVTISNNAIINPFIYIEDSRTNKPNKTWEYCSTNRSHYISGTPTSTQYVFTFSCGENIYADFFGLTPFERMCIEGINVYIGYDGVTDKENAIPYPLSIRHDFDIDRSGNNTKTNNGAFDVIPLTENGEINVAQPFIVRYVTANPAKTNIYFRGFYGYSTMWDNYTGRPFTLVDTEEISGKTLFNGHVVEPKTVRYYEYTVTSLVSLAAPFNGTELALQTYADGISNRAAGIMTEGSNIERGYKLIYLPDNTLDNIAISPVDTEVLLFSNKQFSAKPYNANGISVTGVTYAWEILESTTCTIDNTGLFTANKNGVFTIKCTATQYVDGINDIVVSNTTTVTVNSIIDPNENLALHKPIFAEEMNNIANANDGNTGSRWESAHGTSGAELIKHLYVDLGNTYNLNKVKILWEGARADNFLIQTALELPEDPFGDEGWTTVYTHNEPTIVGSFVTYEISAPAKYIRLKFLHRETGDYGYSIYELEVYGISIYNPDASNDFDAVAVSPNGALTYVGDDFQFNAMALTEGGDQIEEATFTWSVEQQTATIDQTGLFNASAAGSYTIYAESTISGVTKTGSATITVDPARAATSIIFKQQKTNSNTSNETNIFLINEAVPYVLEIRDQYNNLMNDAALLFDISNGGVENTSAKTITSWTDTGIATISVSATKGATVSASFSVQIVPAFTNILPKTSWTATASSYFIDVANGNTEWPEIYAIDNNMGSRWVSGGANTNPQEQRLEWLTIDLGKLYDINMVEVIWEGACAKEYEIQVAQIDDDLEYQKIGGEENRPNDVWNHKWRALNNTEQWARYIRIYCIYPATQYRYSIFEVNVYGGAVPFEVRGGFTNWDINAVAMEKIGETDVYKTTINIPAGTHDYKVCKNGNYPDWWGANRRFTLSEATDVNFYAKDEGGSWLFVCDAQDMYVTGWATHNGGEDEDEYPRLLTKTEGAQYYQGEFNDGLTFKLKVKDVNGYFINNDIIKDNSELWGNGKHRITFVYETFEIYVVKGFEWAGNTYCYVGSSTQNNPEWYRGSAYDIDNPLFDDDPIVNLGDFSQADPLYIGGEMQVFPKLFPDVSVKMFYQIDNLNPVEVNVPYAEDYYDNSKWRNESGVNTFKNITSLSTGTHKITVWFAAIVMPSEPMFAPMLAPRAAPASVLSYDVRAYEILDDNEGKKYIANFNLTDELITSLKEITQQIIIFPNPVDYELKIMNYEFKGDETAQIFDVAGKIVYSSSIINNSINVSSLTKGIYFLKIDNRFVKFIKK